MKGPIVEAVPRSDGRTKLRGEAVYAIDHQEPRMLHGAVLRSPHARARIVEIDVAAAKLMPGVRSVLTAEDAPWVGGWWIADQTALARDEVRFRGEPIVAIAADTESQARAATAAVFVRYEPLPAVVTSSEALAEGAEPVHREWQSHELKLPIEAVRGGNVAWQASFEHGPVDDLFADAAVVVEETYTTERQHQMYLEPRAAVAVWQAGRMTVHTSSQFPFNARQRVSELCGLPLSAVRVVGTTIGGGFGGKLDAAVEPIAALLARDSGRPVRIANSLTEELATASAREGATVHIRTAADTNGILIAHDAVFIMDSGAYAGEGPALAGVPNLQLNATYAVQACRSVTKLVYTNTAPTGAFRGVSGPYVQFVVEGQIDRIAHRLGIDRREIRRRNVHRTAGVMPSGQVLGEVAFPEAFDRVEELAPWAAVRASKPGIRRGVGIGALTWITSPLPGSASVTVAEDGSVMVATAAAEMGTGAVTQGVRQLVAAELGVPTEMVHVSLPDTDGSGFDASAQGSRTTYATGGAARVAAVEVADQARRIAADLLEAAFEDLELRDGQVGVRGSVDSAMPLATVARIATLTSGGLRADRHVAAPPIASSAERFHGSAVTTINGATFHIHFAEVEVDEATGSVRVVRYVVAQDVGKLINPLAVRGQIQGAVAQGIGYSLFEQLRIDDGGIFDSSLETYRIPNALDVPEVETVILEYPDPHGPHGAKGAAEPAIVPVAGVIASAISDAIGQPIQRLPITPEAVLDLLKKTRGGQ